MKSIGEGLSKGKWHVTRNIALAVLVSGSLLAGVGSTGSRVSAANDYGTPDPTFGKGGKVTTDIGSDLEEITSMLVQPDGKIVAAGEVVTEVEDQKYGNYDFALVRYQAPPVE